MDGNVVLTFLILSVETLAFAQNWDQYKSCIDKERYGGQCGVNPARMKMECPNQCQGCKDRLSNCKALASKGDCQTKLRTWMEGNCCESCGFGPKPTAKPQPGCVDKTGKGIYCAYWAKQGHCVTNAVYMKKTCCASCRDVKPNPTQKPQGCVDKIGKDIHCSDWANQGECTTNPDYMKKECCASCRDVKPQPGCVDKHTTCEYWAKTDECKKNPVMMKRDCCKSCRDVKPQPGCFDKIGKNIHCQYWAKTLGECKNNPQYMQETCCRTCRDLDLIPKPKPGCIDKRGKDKNGKDIDCELWALNGECIFDKEYMKKTCCHSCRDKEEGEVCGSSWHMHFGFCKKGLLCMCDPMNPDAPGNCHRNGDKKKLHQCASGTKPL